jgi:hypothetical protein
VLQRAVAPASADAEIAAYSRTSKEVMHVRQFVAQCLDVPLGNLPPTPVYGDNQPALKFAQEHATTSRLKHVPLAHYFSVQCTDDGNIGFHQVASSKNISNFMTKAVGPQELDMFRQSCMAMLLPSRPARDMH